MNVQSVLLVRRQFYRSRTSGLVGNSAHDNTNHSVKLSSATFGRYEGSLVSSSSQSMPLRSSLVFLGVEHHDAERFRGRRLQLWLKSLVAAFTWIPSVCKNIKKYSDICTAAGPLILWKLVLHSHWKISIHYMWRFPCDLMCYTLSTVNKNEVNWNYMNVQSLAVDLLWV